MIIAEHHHDKEGRDACEPDGKHHALAGFIEHTLHTAHTGAHFLAMVHTFWVDVHAIFKPKRKFGSRRVSAPRPRLARPQVSNRRRQSNCFVSSAPRPLHRLPGLALVRAAVHVRACFRRIRSARQLPLAHSALPVP